MRLVKVSIEGYRSIRERLDVTMDPRVTVLLGANDHGKSNFLAALRHLNGDAGFEEEDLNWDLADRAEEFPAVGYELTLSEEEAEELATADAAERLLVAASEAASEREERRAALIGELSEAEEALDEAAAALEDAAAKAKEAEAASAEEPENEQLRDAAKSSAARLSERQHERGRIEKVVAGKRTEVGLADLALALALARRIEAEALGDRRDVEVAVAAAAEAAESAHRGATKNQKRAGTKANEARQAAEELGEDAPEEQRKPAERAVSEAKKELDQANSVLRGAAAEAARLRAAGDALARVAEGDDLARSYDLPVAELLARREVPRALRVSRTGLGGELAASTPEGLEEAAVERFLARNLPRVETIDPQDKLPDDVSLNQLTQESSAFMRGIFLYAGLERSEWPDVFVQDSRSSMRLQKASEQLNETLRASWSQGQSLTFRLQHDSKRSRITLEIMDPAVQSTFTKPSRRSSGFTHFFALKTILHALQSESRRSSYLWVFDEPGLHLHPDGQRDLIQVMETLSESNQVIYATHSVFLANQNYPTRHRLLLRGEQGTVLDSKPFLSRWRTALDALGLSLAGTVLFAPHVLVVEGDSDAIYVTAILRKLIALGEISVDLNRFAAIASGDAATAATLIRFLTDGNPAGTPPHLAVLVDGDDGGKRRLKLIGELTDDREIETRQLTQGTTIEDHLPGGPELYFEAVLGYFEQMVGLSGAKRKALQESFAERFKAGELPKGLVEWTRKEAAALAGLDGKPSSVGIARSYIPLLEQAELEPKESRRARTLADWVAKSLELPEQTLEQDSILE